jgi:hypothetical protein
VSLVRTPLYRATTELLVEPFQRVEEASLDDLATGTSASRPSAASSPPPRCATSSPSASASPPDDPRSVHIDVTICTGTRILTITATGMDPLLVAERQHTYAEAFLDVRRARVLREVTAARDALDDQIDELERTIVSLDEDLDSAARPAGAIGALQLERDVQFSRLSRLLEQRATLVQDGTELSSGGQVLERQACPIRPFRPQPLRDGLLALLVGLSRGRRAGAAARPPRRPVRDELDVRRATGMRPAARTHPDLPPARRCRARRGAISVVDPTSIAAESYRELSTNLRFLLAAARPADERPARRASWSCPPPPTTARPPRR